MSMDLFAALGLPRKWSVTEETLAEAFRTESRKFHPDRYYNKAPAEKREAMARTTDITEAYRTLKDRVARAMYLLRSFGKTIHEQGGCVDDHSLLSEVMEAREEAHELALKGPSGSDGLSKLLNQFDAKVRALDAAMDASFVAIDAGQDPKKVVDTLSHAVTRHRYYCGTRDEIKRALVAVRP